MGIWLKTERHPENKGLNIDYMILDRYLNKDKSPELNKDYIESIATDLKVAPYDVGRVLGYDTNELSTQLIKTKSPLELSKKLKGE